MTPSDSQKSAKSRVFEERLKRITQYKKERSRPVSKQELVEQIPDQEEDKVPQEIVEEFFEENEPVVSRPQTASTWKTSASQKLYIENLEKMLKEEREKRVRIQALIDGEIYANP